MRTHAAVCSDKKKKKPARSFVQGSIPAAMLAFSGPFMLGILLQNLYGAVDLFVVGHFATTADISAVTVGSQLMSALTQLIIGFATGITVLVGRFYGAGDKSRLTRTVGSAVLLFGGAAVVLTALYLALHGWMVTVMKTPAEAIFATKQYLFACSLGIPFIVGYNVVNSLMTGLGDSKTPFLFIFVACVINVAFDVLFVKYFHWGALGAAVATTTAQAGSFLFALLFLRKRGLAFPLSRADIRMDRPQALHVARIGGPVAVQNVLVSVSFLFITAIINQMGLMASAAVGIVEKLITFLFVPAIAMGTAVGTGAAQNLGASQPERARACMWWGIRLALVPAVLITIFCQLDGASLTGLLAKDAAVVAMAANYLRSYIVDILMVSFVFCMNGYFNSLGKSWFSLLHSLLTTLAVRIPMSYLLSRVAGTSLFLIGWASPASTFVSLLLSIVFLWRLKPESPLN